MPFGRLGRRPAGQPMHEINMTPLIDVMLVLLVIFIIAAPLMASSLRLDLPKTDASGSSGAREVLLLALDETGQLYLGDTPVQPEEVSQRVQEAARRDPTTEVQLRADQKVPYGRVAELIARVQQGGLSRIGFVTEGTR
ncbi:MAG: ExbD/TolR family protein [Rubrivivax sp.]|jgi:biopolymer transport protein TolR|nr:biopolymer transporter ExbD [Rubrivivax sp.]